MDHDAHTELLAYLGQMTDAMVGLLAAIERLEKLIALLIARQVQPEANGRH